MVKVVASGFESLGLSHDVGSGVYTKTGATEKWF